VREFAARIDSSPTFVSELEQRLREHLLVARQGRPPRVAAYSGRGSLGGWVRVATLRLARELAHRDRRMQGEPSRDVPAQNDLELDYLKAAYGPAVNRALREALESVKPEWRALLKMHYLDGLTLPQVGVALA